MVTDEHARNHRRPKPADPLGAGQYRSIARKAGLTPQHVSRVLRGLKGASFHVAQRIATAAGVDLDQLYSHIARQPGLTVRSRRTLGDRQPAPRRRSLRSETAA